MTIFFSPSHQDAKILINLECESHHTVELAENYSSKNVSQPLQSGKVWKISTVIRAIHPFYVSTIIKYTADVHVIADYIDVLEYYLIK